MAKGSIITDSTWNFDDAALDAVTGFPGGHVSLKKGSQKANVSIPSNQSSTPITDLKAVVGAIDKLTDMAVLGVTVDLYLNTNGVHLNDSPGRVSSMVRKVKYYDSAAPANSFIHTFSIPEAEPNNLGSDTAETVLVSLINIFKPYGATTANYIIG